MLGSTMALAMGFFLLAAVRLSGNPRGPGFAVFIATLFVALGCAMHLGAMFDRLITPSPWRVVLKLVAWILIGAGTAWVIERAPGDELLVALLIVPGAIGIAAVLVARRDRWSAVPFLGLAVLLVVLLGPVWLGRQA